MNAGPRGRPGRTHRQPGSEERPPDSHGSPPLPIKAGLLTGFGAFAITYAVIYQAVLAQSVYADGGGSVDTWVVSAWSVLVSAGATVTIGGESVSQEQIPASLLVGELTSVLYLGMIVLAGYTIVRYADATSDISRAVKTAATVVPGYAIPSIGLAVIATHPGPDGGTVTIATGDAVIYAGIAVPLFFAVIGGVIAARRAALETGVRVLGG